MLASRTGTGFVRRWGALPSLVLLGVFVLLPLGALVESAASKGFGTFDALARDPLVADGACRSLLLALSAGTVSLVAGAVVAAALCTLTPRQRRAWLAILGVPLSFSGVVIAYGFILAFGRAGAITALLAKAGVAPQSAGALIYSTGGLVFAYAYYLIPRVALMLYPAFANFDRRPLDAALTLGARPWRAWLDVALRELWPSLLAAWCLVTAIALGTYGTALALSGTQINIVPLLLYLKLSDGQTDFTQIAALSIALTALCTCVLAFGECLARTRREPSR